MTLAMPPMPAKSDGFLVSRAAPSSAATETSIRSMRRGRGFPPDLRTDAEYAPFEIAEVRAGAAVGGELLEVVAPEADENALADKL